MIQLLKVSIRAFTPIWVFLYVLQFLLMPLIAQDYWVSNFFGNTMFLLALSYYFIIIFLGFNGTSRYLASVFRNVEMALADRRTYSSPLPEPDGSTTCTDPNPRHPLGH